MFSLSLNSHCSFLVLQNLAIGAGAVGSLQLTYISKVMSGRGEGKRVLPVVPLPVRLPLERRWLALAAPKATSSLCCPFWVGSLSGSLGRREHPLTHELGEGLGCGRKRNCSAMRKDTGLIRPEEDGDTETVSRSFLQQVGKHQWISPLSTEGSALKGETLWKLSL